MDNWRLLLPRQSKKIAHAPIISESIVSFVRANSIRSLGLLLALVFVALLVAIASFNPSDPTFNTATNKIAENWLGLPGAYTADLLLQTVGLAGVMLGLPFLTWGWRLISLKGLPWFWYHILALPFFVLFTAAALASISSPDSWPLTTGLGGYLGQLLYGWADQGFYTLAGIYAPIWAIGLVFGSIATVLFAYSTGLDRDEWRGLSVFVARTIVYIIKIPYVLTLKALGRQTDEDESPTTRVRKTPAKKLGANPRAISKQKKAATGQRASKEQQTSMDLGDYSGFKLPKINLLTKAKGNKDGKNISRAALEQNARLLESVLDDFSIKGEIVSINPGPVVTLYELEPAPGTKSSRVIGLADDIARSMSAVSARVAIVPGRNAIGIELPNLNREMVYLHELIASEDYENSKAKLPLVLGKDIGGSPVIADLSSMPHLLVAGTTGSGKSVGLNTMILSLLYKLSPAECRFIMVDPKVLELSIYDGIPHLLTPVVTNPKKAVVALKWAAREMDVRYEIMSKLKVRNIDSYNKHAIEAKNKGVKLSREVQIGFDRESGQAIFEVQEIETEPMPLIVIIIDEMADLMVVAGKEVEMAVQRLAQKARAAGIHVIMATQRPSVDVITGTIKANFPSRIGFQVSSKIDSRTILGEQGSEQLLGKGDMLYKSVGGGITRVHGPFVSDEEVEAIVSALKKQGTPEYLSEITKEPEEGYDDPASAASQTGNELYDKAVDIVLRDRKASTSYIQRRLRIGYNRAAGLIEEMENNQIISSANHAGKREILVPEQPE